MTGLEADVILIMNICPFLCKDEEGTCQGPESPGA